MGWKSAASGLPPNADAAEVTTQRTCGKPDTDGRLQHLASPPRRMKVMNRAAGQLSDDSGLEAMLKLATVADNWRYVIRRCAWCKRIFDERGAYTTIVAFNASTVTTDGMCAACGRRALAQIAARRGRLAASTGSGPGTGRWAALRPRWALPAQPPPARLPGSAGQWEDPLQAALRRCRTAPAHAPVPAAGLLHERACRAPGGHRHLYR